MTSSNTFAVAYCRVSTQDKQEISPDAQLAEIRTWCAANGFSLISHHLDRGVSGGADLADRPGLMAALNDIRTHKAAVLVATKRDRIARDVILSAMIERMVQREGATVRTVQGVGDGDGPENTLMRRMIDAFSEYERAIIRGRVRVALAHKRSNGETVGRPPYGFKSVDGPRTKLNGKPVRILVPDEAERAVMRLAYWYRHIEGWGIDATGRMLVRKGYRPRSGRDSWNPKTIREFLAAAEELCHDQAT